MVYVLSLQRIAWSMKGFSDALGPARCRVGCLSLGGIGPRVLSLNRLG